MRVDLQGKPLVRPADEADLTGVTTAKRTGPAAWVADGVLDVPFDRTLTATELEGVRRRLTSVTDEEATIRDATLAFLSLSAPTAAETVDQVRRLTRIVLGLLD